jgi:hypothetical protein
MVDTTSPAVVHSKVAFTVNRKDVIYVDGKWMSIGLFLPLPSTQPTTGGTEQAFSLKDLNCMQTRLQLHDRERERQTHNFLERTKRSKTKKLYIQHTYTHYTSLHTFLSLLPDRHTPYHLLPSKSTGFVTMPIARVGAMPNDDNLDKSKEEGKNGRSKATRRKGITIEVGQVWTAACGLACRLK